MDKFPVTKNGFAELEAELKRLKGVDRPNIIAAIAEARSHGDLSENAEYSAAKEKQSFIEGRIQELEVVVSRAQVIDPAQIKGDVIRFGATVVVADDNEEKTYQIVGDYEADINQNKISLSSPLAKALIGKELGEELIETILGALEMEIVKKEGDGRDFWQAYQPILYKICAFAFAGSFDSGSGRQFAACGTQYVPDGSQRHQ